MTITPYISDKLKVLSFASIILVLYIHSGFHDLPNEIHDMPFNRMLQRVIGGQVGRLAVPLFYMISGYLFFRNISRVRDCFPKMRKRVRTLLIPFVTAALFTPLFFLLLNLVPQAARYMNGSGGAEYLQQDWWQFLITIFWKHPGGNMPWAFQLWFLRNLIIVVALSPVVQCFRNVFGG